MKRNDWFYLVQLFSEETVKSTPYLKIRDLVDLAEQLCRQYEVTLSEIDWTKQKLREYRQHIIDGNNVLETISTHIPETRTYLQILLNKTKGKRYVYQQLYTSVEAYRNAERIKEYVKNN